MNELRMNMMDKVNSTSSSSAKIAQGQTVTKAASEATGVEESGKALPPTRPEMVEVDKERVQEAVSRINQYVQQTERTLDFQLDEDSGKTVIRVYDRQSDELIRQIPSELALELAQKLNDEEPSLLFSAQV
jgi:flagellar protein FlaG